MQFNFKSTFLCLLTILASAALSTKVGKPITIDHSKCNDWHNQVRQVIFSGSKIITSSNKMAKLWNRSGNLLRTLAHNEKTDRVSFSNDGNLIATAVGNTVQVRDWHGNNIAILRHKNSVTRVVFNNNSTLIATASYEDGIVKIWQLNGALYAYLPHKGKVYNAVFSHDGTIIATTSSESKTSQDWIGTINVWTTSGNLLCTHHSLTSSLLSLTFSHDDSMIATSNIILDQNGKILLDISEEKHPYKNKSIAFSLDNSIIITRYYDKLSMLFLDGKVIKTLKPRHTFKRKLQSWDIKDSPYSSHVAFSHDNTMIATTITPGDGTARIWDKRGNLLHKLRHSGRIFNDHIVKFVFFSDDNRLATVASDNTIKIWNLNN